MSMCGSLKFIWVEIIILGPFLLSILLKAKWAEFQENIYVALIYLQIKSLIIERNNKFILFEY